MSWYHLGWSSVHELHLFPTVVALAPALGIIEKGLESWVADGAAIYGSFPDFPLPQPEGI